MTLQKKPKILIVDDDSGHLTTLKTITKSWGYNVVTAHDGNVAVDMVKYGGNQLIAEHMSQLDMARSGSEPPAAAVAS